MANIEKLSQMLACPSGKSYVEDFPSFQAAWDACATPGWMLWTLYHSEHASERAFALIYVDVLQHLAEHAERHKPAYERGVAALQQWAIIPDDESRELRHEARSNIEASRMADVGNEDINSTDSHAARDRRLFMFAVANLVIEDEYPLLCCDDGCAIQQVIDYVPGLMDDPDGLGVRVHKEVCDIIRKRHPVCPISED